MDLDGTSSIKKEQNTEYTLEKSSSHPRTGSFNESFKKSGLGGVGSIWHHDPAFEIEYVCSDACSNKEFSNLLKKVVNKHQVNNMRSFLNALHGINLVLQSKTAAYRLITGKDQKFKADDSELKLRQQCVDLAQTDPAWMLTYGPAGDLPVHLTFLLGKRELGREMLQALEALGDEMLDAYWWKLSAVIS